MFKLMGSYTFNKNILKSSGQEFFKLLGTGSKNGFSVFPDFSNYAMISSWKDDADRKAFLEKNKIMTTILSKCHERVEIKIDPYEFKGSWNKINPFKNDSSYKGGKIHCGRCGTCVERQEAMYLAGIKDKTEYEDSNYWKEKVRDAQPKN